MKRLFASSAIVAIAAIGVPVATAATASAAGPPDKSWNQICSAATDFFGTIVTFGDTKTYNCPTPVTVKANRFESFCAAVGGEFSQSPGGDAVNQTCVVHLA